MTPPTQSPVEMAQEALRDAFFHLNGTGAGYKCQQAIAALSSIEQQAQPVEKKDVACKGRNCTAINGLKHSLECMIDHDKAVHSGAENRHSDARYRGYTNEPLWKNATADEDAAWHAGSRAREIPQPITLVDQQAHGAMPFGYVDQFDQFYKKKIAGFEMTTVYASPPSPIPAPSNAQEPNIPTCDICGGTMLEHNFHPHELTEPAQEQGRDDE